MGAPSATILYFPKFNDLCNLQLNLTMAVPLFDDLLKESTYQSDGDTYEKPLNLPRHGGDMRHDLYGQIMGLYDIWTTGTIKVPKVLGYTETTVGMEKLSTFESDSLNFTSFGKLLAKMHRSTPKNSAFRNHNIDVEMLNVMKDTRIWTYGYWTDNTSGLTYQRNKWESNWCNFWMEHRIRFILKALETDGRPFPLAEEVVEAGESILHNHIPSPSLLHGDLWTGNVMCASVSQGDVQLYAFDPAPFYGDREVDLAMTTVFGGFPPNFYEAYLNEWPLSSGSEERRAIYELYFILNHDVLFGGEYRSRAMEKAKQCIEDANKIV